MATKRTLRPRAPSQYSNQSEWGLDVTEEDDFILARRYNAQEKFREYQAREDQGLVKEMNGEDFTLKHVQEHGLASPLVFKDSTRLGMKMPLSNFTVSDVKRLVGSRRQVDVMDTLTQQATIMTMHQWAKYYETIPRKRLLNIISLEFSCTKLAHYVEPPKVVRQLDWVEGVWPKDMKLAQTDPTNDMRKMMYPKVQKYCLMSVSGCYTDFHLDFGGTSVWYHLIRGEKLFLLVPPSEEAYEMFQLWQLSGEQEGVFFADLIEHAQLVRLTAGDTFIMPSGWIHAVYTPSDSLVFGGNFLHSFNIPQQLAVADIESKTKVPSKFRYPFYGTIHWYTLHKYSKELKRLGVKPSGEGETPSNDDMITHSSPTSDTSNSQSSKSARWLKEVSVEKVSLDNPSFDEHCSDVTSPDTKSTNHTSTPSHPHQSHISSTPSHLHQPHISAIETEGLLTLVQRMKDDELFQLDVPPSLAISPTDLLAQLASQLQSPSLTKLCSVHPTGTSLLHKGEGSGSKRKRNSKLPSSKKQPRYSSPTTTLPSKEERFASSQTPGRETEDKHSSPTTTLPSKEERFASSQTPGRETEDKVFDITDCASTLKRSPEHKSPMDRKPIPESVLCLTTPPGDGSFNSTSESPLPLRTPPGSDVQTPPVAVSPFSLQLPSTPSLHCSPSTPPQPHNPLSTPSQHCSPSTPSQPHNALSTPSQHCSTISTPSQHSTSSTPSQPHDTLSTPPPFEFVYSPTVWGQSKLAPFQDAPQLASSPLPLSSETEQSIVRLINPGTDSV